MYVYTTPGKGGEGENMDAKQYPELALQFLKSTMPEAGDKKTEAFKKLMLRGIISPSVENVEDRQKLTAGEKGYIFFRDALKYDFERNGKFLKAVASISPNDKNISYLQTVYKILSYKTAVFNKKQTGKADLHPAFFPFIDAVDALRRASFLSLCTVWTASDMKDTVLSYSKQLDSKLKDSDILSMKLINPFLFNNSFFELDGLFGAGYEEFKAKYFLESDFLKTDKRKRLKTGPEVMKELLLEQQHLITKEIFPPTLEAFKKGTTFFKDVITERLRALDMDCTIGPACFVPIFKGYLHPLFCYEERTQGAYLEKLEQLKPQRNKNVIKLLQDAEQVPEEKAGVFLKGMLFFYKALREALPPERAGKELETISQAVTAITKKVDKVDYPIDKVNNNLWNDLEYNKDGQLAFVTGKVKGNEVSVIMGINFETLEGVKMSRTLNHFDKRVYIAVSALWNAGNSVITLTQIHYTMGNTKKPAKSQLDKINESVSKMMRAILYLDNAEEIEGKLKYPEVKIHYDAALLPMERMAINIKGMMSDAAIHIFREPPLMSFAKNRKQVTTFEAKLLQSPMNKTDSNLAIEDYLLERIAGAKHNSLSNVILYETLFSKLGITDRRIKPRILEKLKIYFDYYKDCGQIKNYVAESDKLTFYF